MTALVSLTISLACYMFTMNGWCYIFIHLCHTFACCNVFSLYYLSIMPFIYLLFTIALRKGENEQAYFCFLSYLSCTTFTSCHLCIKQVQVHTPFCMYGKSFSTARHSLSLLCGGWGEGVIRNLKQTQYHSPILPTSMSTFNIT